VDRRGEASLDVLGAATAELAGRDPGPFTASGHAAAAQLAAETPLVHRDQARRLAPRPGRVRPGRYFV